MNLAELEKKLIAAARANAPEDRVPYAFEQRVMARLRTSSRTDELAWWGRALWYGASACAVVTLMISAWTFAPDSDDVDQSASFSQGVEQTLFASTDDSESTW